MIVYNVTFHAEVADAQHLLTYLHESYIPQSLSSGIMRNARLSRIISHNDEGVESFSVQFECDSVAMVHRWYTDDGQRLSAEMVRMFKDRVVGFPTMMEVIE